MPTWDELESLHMIDEGTFAKLLGKTRGAMRQMRLRGLLPPCKKIGRQFFYLWQVVKVFLQVDAPPPEPVTVIEPEPEPVPVVEPEPPPAEKKPPASAGRGKKKHAAAGTGR